jgi:hypothetical protein
VESDVAFELSFKSFENLRRSLLADPIGFIISVCFHVRLDDR